MFHLARRGRAGAAPSEGMLVNSVVAVAVVAVLGGILYKVLLWWSSALGGLDGVGPGGGPAGNLDPRDLVRAIGEAAPPVAEVLRSHTFQAVQEYVPVLGEYVAVRISAREAPEPNRFVVAYRPGGKAFVFTTMLTEWDRFRAETRPKIEVDAEALETALWYVRAREPDLVVMRRREEVPFASRLSGDDGARLRDGLRPPAVKTVTDGWEASLVALRGRMLRRYTVKVGGDARLEVHGEDWIEGPNDVK